MAAPSYRSSGTAASGTVTTLTPGNPAGAVSGDILIAQCLSRRTTPPSFLWPTGWTQVVSENLSSSGRTRHVGVAWIRRGTTAPDMEFEISSGQSGWSVAVHAISGAVVAGNPLDQLDGTEYASAAIGTLVATWQPTYTPTTATAETLAMSMVFTTDDNEIGLLAGSEQGFTHSYAATSDVSRDRAMALATRELSSVSTLTMPTYEQLTMAPDEWSGVFIAVAATSPSVAEVMFTFPPSFTLAPVSDVTLSGTLFSKPPSFVAGQVQSQAAPDTTLSGALFSRPPTFTTGAVRPQSVTVTGVLFSKSPTFPAGVAQAQAPGAVTLFGVLFSRPPTFLAGALQSSSADATLSGVLFSKPPAFTAGAVQSATVAVVVPAYVGEVIRMEIEVFSAGQVWLDARVADESLWSGTFTGDNEINAGLFIGRVQWRNSGDRMTINRTNASTNTLSDARSAGGSLSGLYMHVTHSGTGQVFTSDEITNTTLAGNAFMHAEFGTAIPAATAGGTATIVFATNVLAGLPTTVTLSGALLSKPPSFPAGAVQAPSAEITLSGALTSIPPTFVAGAVQAQAPGSITSFGVLFTRPPTFVTGVVQLQSAPAATLSGVLFSKPPTFVAGVVQSGTPAPTVSIETQNQAIAGGTLLQLAATTTEVDTYAWTAIPDLGAFSDTTVEDPTWTAPPTESATQITTLRLTVTDVSGITARASITIRVTGTVLLSVAIDGVTIPLLANRFKLRDRVAERSTADLQIRDDVGSCPLCTAEFGTLVSVSSPDGIVFDGFIYTVTTRRLAPAATGTPTIMHAVRLMDNHYRADKRLVAASYRDMTAGEIALALWADILESEGVYAATDGTPAIGDAPAGAVFNGIELRQVIFNYVPISTALDRLAEASNYVWQIGHDRNLHFQPRSTVVSPWSLTGTNIQGVPVLTKRGTKYRNRQIVTGGQITTNTQTEIFSGDGNQQTFTVSYPLATVPQVQVNRGNGYAVETVGIRGLGTGSQWYWNKGSNEITQELTDTPLTDTHLIRIAYKGLAPVVAVVNLLGEQQVRAAVEKTTTGIVDALHSGAGLDSSGALIGAANAQLLAYGQVGQELRFTTRRSGLESGQLLSIALPDYGIDGIYLISEVQIRDRSARWLEYRVRAISGPITGSWAKFFKEELAQPGQDILENISETQDLLLLADGEDEVWDWTETVSQTVHSCPIPATSLRPSSSLLPC